MRGEPAREPAREVAARVRTINLIRCTIIMIISAATLHGGIQLGANALEGGLSTDPSTYITQGLQAGGALVLLLTSRLCAGNVMPLHPPDEPRPPLKRPSLITGTLLAASLLSTAGSLTLRSLTLTGTAPWSAVAVPTATWPTDPVTIAAIIAAAVGLMLWITACEWIRLREKDHNLQGSW